MKRYLGNAFSLGMLDCLSNGAVVAKIKMVDPFEILREWSTSGFESCVGHSDTAQLFTALLGVPIEMRRVSTSLERGDEILVGQYNGPRLPEGATSLPEGAKIRWILVEVEGSHILCEGCCCEGVG